MSILDLLGRDPFAADLEHLLLAAGQEQEALVVAVAEIAEVTRPQGLRTLAVSSGSFQ